MAINSVSLNNTTPGVTPSSISPTDSETKSIQNEITNQSQRLNRLSSDSEMSAEEKAKKRQEIQKEIAELNRKASLLAAKYEGDSKYVRLHHEFMRKELTTNERKIFDILMGIKKNTDEMLLNSDILKNDAYFESFIQQQVVMIFKANEIKLNPEVARLVKSAIVREYVNEREGITE